MIPASLRTPPDDIRRRAWECAFVLREEFWDSLALEHAIAMEVILRTGPDALGWRECGEAFRIFGSVAETRV